MWEGKGKSLSALEGGVSYGTVDGTVGSDTRFSVTFSH